MLKELLCFLGLHNWISWEEWLPSFSAPIVTQVIFARECSSCGKRNITVMCFDKEKGLERQ